MRAILNIDGAGLTFAQIHEALTSVGIQYGRHSWYEVKDHSRGCSWETLAVSVLIPFLGARKAVDQLARLLGQNCIAVYDCETMQGMLVGPDTSKYEPFNAELFRVV